MNVIPWIRMLQLVHVNMIHTHVGFLTLTFRNISKLWNTADYELQYQHCVKKLRRSVSTNQLLFIQYSAEEKKRLNSIGRVPRDHNGEKVWERARQRNHSEDSQQKRVWGISWRKATRWDHYKPRRLERARSVDLVFIHMLTFIFRLTSRNVLSYEMWQDFQTSGTAILSRTLQSRIKTEGRYKACWLVRRAHDSGIVKANSRCLQGESSLNGITHLLLVCHVRFASEAGM